MEEEVFIIDINKMRYSLLLEGLKWSEVHIDPACTSMSKGNLIFAGTDPNK